MQPLQSQIQHHFLLDSGPSTGHPLVHHPGSQVHLDPSGAVKNNLQKPQMHLGCALSALQNLATEPSCAAGPLKGTQFRCLDFAANFHHSELLSVLDQVGSIQDQSNGIPRYPTISHDLASCQLAKWDIGFQKSGILPKCHVNRENDDKA